MMSLGLRIGITDSRSSLITSFFFSFFFFSPLPPPPPAGVAIAFWTQKKRVFRERERGREFKSGGFSNQTISCIAINSISFEIENEIERIRGSLEKGDDEPNKTTPQTLLLVLLSPVLKKNSSFNFTHSCDFRVLAWFFSFAPLLLYVIIIWVF